MAPASAQSSRCRPARVGAKGPCPPFAVTAYVAGKSAVRAQDTVAAPSNARIPSRCGSGLPPDEPRPFATAAEASALPYVPTVFVMQSIHKGCVPVLNRCQG